MSFPVRTRPPRSPFTVRSAGAALATALAVAGCGTSAPAEGLAPPAAPGQPAGTVVLTVTGDVAQVAQRVQDAITASGGTVTAVVDHTADARTGRAEIPPSTLVVGGSPAAQVPLLRADQRAAAELPSRFLVRRTIDGTVTLTGNGPGYVAAVSGVAAPEAWAPLREDTNAVLGRVAPGTGTPVASPLVGVTPVDHLVTEFGSADVPVTVERLRRNADRGDGRAVAVDLSAGSADPGPAIRPTSVVLVTLPEVEAPLLAAAPSIGLDLPLRFVVWLDDQQRTQIGYPDVRRIAARHGVAADDPDVARLATEADRLARLAAGIDE